MILRLWRLKSASECEACGRYSAGFLPHYLWDERERDALPRSMASSRAARDGSQKKEARSLLKILVRSETRMSLTVNLSEAMLPRLIGSQEFSKKTLWQQTNGNNPKFKNSSFIWQMNCNSILVFLNVPQRQWNMSFFNVCVWSFRY